MFSFVILFYLPDKVYFLFIVWFIIISRVVDFLIRHTFYSKIKFRIAVRNYTLQIKKADVNILHIVKIIRSIFFPNDLSYIDAYYRYLIIIHHITYSNLTS